MKTILFLCTGNSCRSQMAEGWARQLHQHKHKFFSAGIKAHGLNPKAVTVMAEAGIDISHHRSKILGELKDVVFDVVFTVCGHANETCPIGYFGKAKIEHVGFNDPPKLEQTCESEEQKLAHYRRVRDEIKDFVLRLEEYLDV